MAISPPITSAFPSRFVGLSRGTAVGTLTALAALIVVGVVLSMRAPLTVPAATQSVAGAGDLALYRSIVSRVRGGENYYSAAAAELRARNYALRPAFNFRPPTLAWTVAAFPSDQAARWVLTALTWLAFSVWTVRFLRMNLSPVANAIVLAVTATGSLLGIASAGLYWHELWSGLFVMIALGIYGPGTWVWSAIAGLAACLFRELALPLPFVMAVFALRERRFREAAAWMAVVAVFAVVLTVHLHHAAAYVRADDLANSWSAFGGWTFLLSTARWNYALIPAPDWVLAVVVPLALVGLIGWRHPAGARTGAVVVIWFMTFMFIGRPDNHYWGMIYSPLIAVGCALAPFSLASLVRTARRGRTQPGKTSAHRTA